MAQECDAGVLRGNINNANPKTGEQLGRDFPASGLPHQARDCVVYQKARGLSGRVLAVIRPEWLEKALRTSGAIEARQHAREPMELNRYASNATSQHGEDGILEYIIHCLGERAVRIACEVGAWDGVAASNTFRLWHELGWRAVLIEGDKDKYKDLLRNTLGRDVFTVNRFITAAGADSLDQIFAAAGAPYELGVLCIDIDSYDYHVWKNLRLLNPQIVIIEFNPNIPPYIDYYDPEGSVYLKCSAKALERLGQEKGYRLVCCTKVNGIFVRNDLFNRDQFPEKPVEALFDYSELKPQVIFAGEHGNMYPVFSKRTRAAMKFLMRFYYWVDALPKRQRCFVKPPAEIVAQLRKSGMDA